MTTAEQMSAEADKISDLYSQLEADIVDHIISALTESRYRLVDQDNIILWQAEQLDKMGLLTQEIIQLLAELSGRSEQQITHLITQSGMQVSNQISDLLNKLTGKRITISADNQQLLKGIQQQTFKDLNNVVNQSLISDNTNSNGVLQAYQKIINQSALEVISGLKTFNRALADNVYTLVKAGIRTGLTDKAGHNWSLEGYSRMVLQTAAHNTFNEVRLSGMHSFDVTLAVMSTHQAAREACAPIQGKIVNTVPRTDPRFNPNYPTIYDYGYGKPAGTQGINCHHSLFSFIEGVSTNPFADKAPDPDIAVANAKLRARQRLLERNIRKDKQLIDAAVKLDDQNGIDHYKHQLFNHRTLLRQHIKAHAFLHRDYSREKVVSPLSKDYNKFGRRFKYARNEINPDKFNRHIVGTKEYDQYLQNRFKQGFSYPPSQLQITTAQAQSYIKRYGVIDSITKNTAFNAGKTIATFIDQDSGERLPTSLGLISYSKSGAHITPLDPRREHNNGR